MNIWETVTGSDMTRDFKAFEQRLQQLPPPYQKAWAELVPALFPYGDFTGRNLIPALDGALTLFEESVAEGLPITDVVGDDVPAFAAALAGGEGSADFRDRWRNQLNRNVARKLARQGG
jgi:DNA-binding ferritin-like protein (Dps family)